MSRMPVLFISHGSPEVAVRETPAHHFLKGLGHDLPKPKAILVVTAHWETAAPKVSTASQPGTIYDFGRFDNRLFEINYRAPGAPEVAKRAAALLEDHGIATAGDAGRGYDHGTWVPLYLLFPDADIPVAQLSIQPQADPAHHHRLGAALRPLRDEGVLIIASGSLTHNLREFFGRPVDAPAPEWVSVFADWMAERLLARDEAALLDYRREAPEARRNHPTDEHLLPLFTALGASLAEDGISRLHASYEHGVIAMDVYRFGS